MLFENEQLSDRQKRHIRQNPAMNRKRCRRVAAIVYDGLCTFEFGIVVEIFGLPRPEFGKDWYRFEVR